MDRDPCSMLHAARSMLAPCSQLVKATALPDCLQLTSDHNPMGDFRIRHCRCSFERPSLAGAYIRHWLYSLFCILSCRQLHRQVASSSKLCLSLGCILVAYLYIVDIGTCRLFPSLCVPMYVYVWTNLELRMYTCAGAARNASQAPFRGLLNCALM